jgi:hypothetical protein
MKKKSKPSTDLPEQLEIGMLLRFRNLEGDRGTYALMSLTPGADGSLTLYGGDVDPGGHRCYRSVMPERLQLEDRKHILAKRQRQEHE